MSSRFDNEKFTIDGDNNLLWRMNPRRLEVEAWRDSLLAVSGELDRTIGGKPDREILRSKRRTLYATISRTGDKFDSDAFLRLFDFPAAVSTSASRPTSTVPQQYLFMLNSPFMTERREDARQPSAWPAGAIVRPNQQCLPTTLSPAHRIPPRPSWARNGSATTPLPRPGISMPKFC